MTLLSISVVRSGFGKRSLFAGGAAFLMAANGLSQSFTKLPFPAGPGSTLSMSGNGKTFTGFINNEFLYAYFSTSGNVLGPIESQLGTWGPISRDGSTLIFNTAKNAEVYGPAGLKSVIPSFSVDASSSDGNILYGATGYVPGSGFTNAAYNATTGLFTPISLPSYIDNLDYVNFCSGDGSIAFGQYGYPQLYPFEWTPSGGTQSVNGMSFVTSCSQDGSVLGGYVAVPGGGYLQPTYQALGVVQNCFTGYSAINALSSSFAYAGVQVSESGRYLYATVYGINSSTQYAVTEDLTTGTTTNFGPSTSMVAGSEGRFLTSAYPIYNPYGDFEICQASLGSVNLTTALNALGLAPAGWSQFAAVQLTDDGSGILGTALDQNGNYVSWYGVIPLGPSLGSLAPSSRAVDSTHFTLVANGFGFDSNSTLLWNGTPLQTETYTSTQIKAEVPASYLANAAVVPITVRETGGPVSNSLNFTVFVPNPVPTTTSTSPTTVQHGGGGFTITVYGTNFLPTSTVKWGGLGIPTQYVSSTKMTAVVPANYYAIKKVVPVTVVSPVPGGGVSNPTDVTVD